MTTGRVNPVAAPGDAALVDCARATPRCFSELWERYYDHIYRYCRYRLASAEDAEDIATDIFVRAYEAIERFDPARGSFRGWLFTIAHHQVVDAHRRRRGGVEPLSDDIPAAAKTPEESAIDGDAWSRMIAMLARFPEDQRRILELRIAGLTGLEIAATLGKSHDAVRKAESRAMARLRAEFGEASDAR